MIIDKYDKNTDRSCLKFCRCGCFSLIKSHRRPGVAITISGLRFSIFLCFSCDIPPTTIAVLMSAQRYQFKYLDILEYCLVY